MKQFFNYSQPPVHPFYSASFLFHVHSVIKNTFHSCKKKEREKSSSKNSNKASRSREAHKQNINKHTSRLTPCRIAFCRYFLPALNASSSFAQISFFLSFYSFTVRRERRKIYGYRLKSFFTLRDESTHEHEHDNENDRVENIASSCMLDENGI